MSAPRTTVLLGMEAAARGFKNSLAFRRWCRANHVPLLPQGRRLWVSPADVDAVLERLKRATVDATASVSNDGTPKTESEHAAEAAFAQMRTQFHQHQRKPTGT